MLGFSCFAVNLPALQQEWALSSAEAGLIAAGFFLGYALAVSFWNALTDRLLAVWIYRLGVVLSAAGSAMFAVGAEGVLSGLLGQMLLGAGVAATYMPGLRLLPAGSSSRHIAFYTSSFGIGVAASLGLCGLIAEAYGWRASFWASAVGPLGAALFVGWGAHRLGATRPPETPPAGHPPVWRLVLPLAQWAEALRSADVGRAIAGYGAHCLELFGTRAWTVAFFVAAGSVAASSEQPPSAADLAMVVSLLSTPASILGNELCERLGRERWLRWTMSSAAVLGVGMALLMSGPWWLVFGLACLHSMVIMADSAALTAGLMAAAPERVKGASMGLYSLVGFLAGALGPVLLGAVLDLTGGQMSPMAWALGFFAIGAAGVAYTALSWTQTRQRNLPP